MNNGEEPVPVNFFISIKMGLRFKKYTQYNSSYILLKKLPVKLVVDKKTWEIEMDRLNQDWQDERWKDFPLAQVSRPVQKRYLAFTLIILRIHLQPGLVTNSHRSADLRQRERYLIINIQSHLISLRVIALKL